MTLLLAAFFAATQLSQVTSVYLLPMAGGLDQYLASRLTSEGIFQVVTDPQKADAIFTDQLGESFERRFEELYPPAPAPEKKAEKKSETKGEAAEKGKEDEKPAKPVDQRQVRLSSFGRGKGNLFLVSRQTRNVLWSLHLVPKGSSPADLDAAAASIAKKLKAEK